MRRSDLEQQTVRLVPYVTVGGIGMIVIGLLFLRISSDSIVLSFAALFSIVVGAALFTPLSMIILSWLISPFSGEIFGVLGRMAPRALVRSISRTSIAVAALTLAVSVIVGVGVMVSSFRITVEDWLGITLGADIFISTPGLSTDSNPNVDPALADQLLQVEGVESVPVVRTVDVIAPDYPDLPPVRITAVDVDISHGRRRFVWKNVPEGTDYRDLIAQGKVIVSEPFAFHRGITPENNLITLLTDQGNQTFEIIGVYYDYTSDQGTVRMDLETYRRYWDDPYITSLAIILKDGVDVHEVIDTLRTETLAGYDLEVQSNRELREGALEVFDRTFSITIALQILATIVAFIGILSALMALQLEHVREYGIMRANGMTPNQLRKFTLLQTGIMGTISGLLSLPIGLSLAFILIHIINVRSFGWSMDLTLPPKEFLQAFGVALVASLAAGIYPAWRVSTIQAADALRSE
jgi:putative ABC transport system permease protein